LGCAERKIARHFGLIFCYFGSIKKAEKDRKFRKRLPHQNSKINRKSKLPTKSKKKMSPERRLCDQNRYFIFYHFLKTTFIIQQQTLATK